MSNKFNSDVSDVNKALKKNIISLKRTFGPNAAVYVQAEKHFVDVSSKLQAAAQEVKLIREKLSARFKLLNKKGEAAPKTPSHAEDGDSVDSSTLTTISTIKKKKKPVQIAVVTKNTTNKEIDQRSMSPPPLTKRRSTMAAAMIRRVIFGLRK